MKYVRANASNHSVIIHFDDEVTGIDEFANALSRRGYEIEGAPQWFE